jgi:hypothetical protein
MALTFVCAHAADKVPKPPPMLCVGSNCVAPTPGAGGLIKWNPGHYAGSNGSVYGGGSASTFYPSMDGALTNYPLFKGYRLWITWAALEPSEGQYDFSVVDTILDRLKTRYGTPRHLILNLYPSGPVGHWSKNDHRVVPGYIQDTSTYGPSPVPGKYGIWGPSADGEITGAYEPALWRPAVMDRFIALIKALGDRYDKEPYFEGMMFQEGVYHILAAGSDYTHADMLTQVKRMLTSATAAFPHTNVIYENTWGFGPPSTNQDFEVWMVNNRIAPGTADSIGESAFQRSGVSAATAGSTRPPALNWGMAAYMGITVSGSSYSGGDLRSKARGMLDIEADDIAGTYYAGSGGPFTPADICEALNNRYKASHAFWDKFDGTEKVRGQPVPDSAKWPNLAAALSKCPLQNTDYPPNYPH